MTRKPARRTLAATAALVLCLPLSAAEEPPAAPRADAPDRSPVEVFDVSVWAGEPSRSTLNGAKAYRNPMPNAVGTSRPKLEADEAAAPFPIAPASFIQFFGDPCRDVDVDLRIKAGSFLAHWPPGKEHAGRIRWLGSELLSRPPADLPPSYLPDDGGLLSKLRGEESALYLKDQSRFERFIAYDAEVAAPAPVRLRGGPDHYTLRNLTGRPLLDVAIVVPTDAGFRVAWVDELPSAASDTPADGAGAAKADRAGGGPGGGKADAAKRAEDVFGGDDAPGEKKPAPPDALPAEADAEMLARVDQFLQRPITLAVESAPRRQILGMVSAECRILLEFDDKTLAAEKVDLDKPAGLSAANLPARDALGDLLGAVGLSYRVTQEGRLYVTTAARIAAAADKKGGPVEGPPVKLSLSQPLKASDPSYVEFTQHALARRLEGRGLRKDVVSLLLDRCSKALFEPGEMLVLAHLSREAIDEIVPLDVFPPPRKLVRSALVVTHGVDPRLQDRAKILVRQLGDPSWATREAAEARLLALGTAAVPALEEGLRDKDVEVVFRVERLLLKLDRKVP